MLDPVSILIVTVLSSIMSVAILGSLRRAAIPGVGRWMGANLVAIVALVLFALQRHVPAVAGVLAANLLLAIAVVIVLEGCRQFFGLAPVLWPAYAGCAAVAAGIAWWTWVEPGIDARIAVVSAFHGAIYALIGWIAWRHRPPGRPAYSYRFVTGAAWLGALGHLSRGLVYGEHWEHQTALLQATPLNVAFLSVGILALPALSIGMVMLAHDRMAERLERWANQDELTGALTRRAFIARAGVEFEAARVTGEPLTLAIVDIDHFKSINDRYGHATGDRVLAHFGRIVTGNIRASDLFGRLGGEEFAVLFVGMDRTLAIERLDALRIQTRAARRNARVLTLEGGVEPGQAVTFSAGVDEFRSGDTLAGLLARADAALYAAKTLGRDRVVAA